MQMKRETLPREQHPGRLPGVIPACAGRGEAMPDYGDATIVRQRAAAWSGVTARLFELRSEHGLEADLTPSTPRLSMMLETVGGRSWIHASRAPGPGAARTSAGLDLLPAFRETWLLGPGIRYARHLVIDLDGDAIAEVMTRPLDLAPALRQRSAMPDARLDRLCRLLADELADDAGIDPALGDSLSIAIVRRLADLGTGEDDAPRPGGLAPWQLRRVTDYPAAHLEGDTSIEKLASLARLSPSHFIRAFKSTAGMPPHRWLLLARCERAKHLMMETDAPLAAIALQVGFGDQAHFSRMFGRLVGTSPKAWRRERSC